MSDLTRRQTLTAGAAALAASTVPAVAGGDPDALIAQAAERTMEAHHVLNAAWKRFGDLMEADKVALRAARPAVFDGKELGGDPLTVLGKLHRAIDASSRRDEDGLRALLSPTAIDRLVVETEAEAEQAKALLPLAEEWAAEERRITAHSPRRSFEENDLNPANDAAYAALKETMAIPAQTFNGIVHKARLLNWLAEDAGDSGYVENDVRHLLEEIEALGGRANV